MTASQGHAWAAHWPKTPIYVRCRSPGKAFEAEREPRPSNLGGLPRLRNQFREQFFTLFRHDRVLPLFGLERVDHSEEPQNKAADP
jgi:hypothetical protein